MRVRRLALLFAVAGLAACAAETTPRARFHGVELSPARLKPDFELTSTGGQPFHFRARTDGTLTLLFFGYTHCPDVCPVHMTNIAAALDKLPAGERERVHVVFVTTDPERDTPERLREWLGNFGDRFTGLRGSMDEVNRIQYSLGLAAAVKEPPSDHAAAGTYTVGHGAQVLAFTPDDSLRVLYPFGVRQHEWAEDIPALLRVR